MFETILQWVLAFMSIVMIWKMGDKDRLGPIIGLVSQVLWLVYTSLTGQWGLFFSAIVFTYVHARNLYLWAFVKVIQAEEA